MPKGYKDAAIRSQFGTVFNWVVDHELKGAAGAIQLQADAVSQLALGNTSLIGFVNKHQCDLQDQISFIWSLKTAPEENNLKSKPLQKRGADQSMQSHFRITVEMRHIIMKYCAPDADIPTLAPASASQQRGCFETPAGHAFCPWTRQIMS